VPDILTALSAPLFWVCAAAIAIAQVRILRSTRRAWMHGKDGAPNPPPPGIAEWSFAVGPVVILGVLLWATWRAVAGFGGFGG
jgi:hypothetical protein